MTWRKGNDCLQNKTALITGNAGALGLAVAKIFVSEGANAVLVDVSEPALQRALQSLGPGRATSVAADVTCPDGTQRCVQAALDRHGGIAILLAKGLGGNAPL
jgi:NAD(P)-dependent dehydrogenase (short-subunit alcohol dehydrogenase family)